MCVCVCVYVCVCVCMCVSRVYKLVDTVHILKSYNIIGCLFKHTYILGCPNPYIWGKILINNQM